VAAGVRKAAVAILLLVLGYLVLSAIIGLVVRLIVIAAVAALVLFLLWGGPSRRGAR